MARERSPNRDKAFELYKESNGKIQNREIANILGISEKTVSGWKVKDKWNSKLNGVLQKVERSTPKEKKRSNKKKEPIAKEVEEVIENDDLTEKQRLFCLYYIKTYNATRSYQKAYNCSYEVANVEGFKNLVKPSIREEILQLKKIRMHTDFMDAGDVVRKYQEIAFADEEILDGTEVRTTDKLKALDFLTKYYKLLESESETKEDKLDQYLEQLQGVLKDD
ncbi:MAG: terminase small subunit [Turicibacter sp.]|nr:terminase small subunit [Turicibacter sp.]